ncbi:C-type lectin domain family 4 member G-like [Osmerus eperlanus]|uniref:C-type lectin domain family 4 member G-like n=1 Tax=Osmerus eperlanus TaxID=29151 RepID=UPI002E152C2C
METDEDVYANVDDVWATEVERVGEKVTRRGDREVEAAGYQVLHKRPELTEGKAVESLKMSPDADRKFGRSFSVDRKCELGRLAVLCLGLLCGLLLATVIGLSVFYLKTIHHSTQLQTSYDSLQIQYDLLRTERDQLQTSYDSLQTQYDLLSTERDQLQTSYTSLGTERHKQQLSFQNLSLERDHLQRMVSRLEMSAECCPGWKKFQSSCYYLSTEEKTWEESSQYCRGRGTNLVIIKSREEQVFLNGLHFNQKFWMGLTDTEQEGVWKWVDGTRLKLTETFWRGGEPNNADMREHCGVFNKFPNPLFLWNVHLSSWNDEPCDIRYQWVCKRKMAVTMEMIEHE